MRERKTPVVRSCTLRRGDGQPDSRYLFAPADRSRPWRWRPEATDRCARGSIAVRRFESRRPASPRRSATTDLLDLPPEGSRRAAPSGASAIFHFPRLLLLALLPDASRSPKDDHLHACTTRSCPFRGQL